MCHHLITAHHSSTSSQSLNTLTLAVSLFFRRVLTPELFLHAVPLSALFMSGRRCLIVSHLIWPRQPGDVSWSVSDSQLSGLRPLPGPGQVSSNNTRNQSLAARRVSAVSKGRQAQSTHTDDRCSDDSPSQLSTSQFSLLHLLAFSYTKQRNSWRCQRCLLTPLPMITHNTQTAQSLLEFALCTALDNKHHFLTYFN